jgi:hypothetical protein
MNRKLGALIAALLVGILIVGLSASNDSRTPTMFVSSSTPPSAGVDVGYLWYDTTAGALKVVSSTGPVVWTAVGGGTSSGGDPVPTGAILIMATGVCPAAYVEETSLDGRMPIGTLVANGDLGATGGSNTLTPAGTNSAPALTMNSYTPGGTNSGGAVSAHTGTNVTSLFTGSALGTHAHELPFQIASTTTTRQLASATFGTGTSRAATGVSAAGVANTTSAAVALSQAVSAGTPAGTVANTITQPSAHTFTQPTFAGIAATLTGTVAAPVFTGASAENRSAFAKVLFCRKS